VKAQVKLKFRNTNGKHLVASRRLQVTRRDKTVTQRSTESSLKYTDPNTGQVKLILFGSLVASSF
jgi:DNA repair protein RAD50